MSMKQLLLELAPPAQPDFDNFVIGANRELVEALRAAARGRFGERVIYVWGESGSGKTHLAQAVGAAVEFAVVTAPQDAVPEMAQDSLVVVPDVQLLDAANQIRLFNLINNLSAAAVFATGPCAPRDLALRRDLATRLASGLVYQVHALSDDEKAAALVAHARARGFTLGDDIIAYLLRHVRRDMPSLIAVLDALDRYSLECGRPVTLPLLKDALNLH
jgi:DnaA family protein